MKKRSRVGGREVDGTLLNEMSPGARFEMEAAASAGMSVREYQRAAKASAKALEDMKSNR